MKSVLICPSERPAVQFLSQTLPLAAVPLLGQSLLEYWLSWLANAGAREVLVSAHDRPEQVRAIVGTGARWGIAATVIAETRELSASEALLKYGTELGPSFAHNGITVLDRFPGGPEQVEADGAAGSQAAGSASLFASYGEWLAAVLAWAPRAVTPDRVGVHEIQPGVWVGMHGRISPGAELRAPCWLGKNVWVGSGASIGPEAIVEDGAVIETAAAITHSYIGPDTLVGQFARIAHSLAWGDTLVDLQTGSHARVADSFLLCFLRRPAKRRSPSLVRRLSDIYLRNKEEAQVLWKHLVMNKEG